MYGAVAVATLITYWRLPPGSTYHFADTGWSGAGSRLVTYANYPVALGAIALVGAVARGRLAWLAIALCAVVAAPGVVSQDDLTATWANAPAVAGVALAVWLTWWSPPQRRRVPLGSLRVVLIGLLAVWSLPWVIAALGLYAQDLPLLGDVIRARQPTPGEPHLASVHLGLHEGLFGAMLAVTALVLSARRMPAVLSLYLSLLLCYGVTVSANDGWNEQVVKRGWVDTKIPSVLTPSLSVAWAVVLASALAVHLLWFQRQRHR
ncbi:MAG: hypothetical protein QOF08_553 [Gaiellales bacterium]|jgi:hypothetical protein|nr:hypothetical protein [Gaiellales bacterium]